MGPSNLSILRKNDTLKSHGSRCLMLWSKSWFLYLFRKFVFLWEEYNSPTAVRSDVKGSKPGGNKVQLVRRACMPTIHQFV